MKTFLTILLASTLSVVAVSCSEKPPKTVAEMTEKQLSEKLIGDWVMDDITVEQDGVEVRMFDTTMSYKIDGTSYGDGKMEFMSDEMPANLGSFKIVVETNWSMESGLVRDKITGLRITPLKENAQSSQIAALLQNQMVNAPSTTSEILAISDNILVLESDGIKQTYRR